MSMLVALVVAVCVLDSLARWRVYQKMGINGWKTLIPFYCTYVLFKALYGNCKNVLVFWFAPIVSWIIMVNASSAYRMDDGLRLVLMLISLALIIWYIKVALGLYIDLAKAFGQKKSFGWGLLLVGSIFMVILGFSDHKFRDGSVSITESDIVSGAAYKLDNWIRTSRSSKDAVTLLKELAELREKGIVDEETYLAKKDQLLKRI